jgi:glycerol kinase
MLDAIAFQSVEVIQAMQRDSGVAIPFISVDGGVVESDVLMQTQADLLGINVRRPCMRDATAFGAAIAAGIGAGEEIGDAGGGEDVFSPGATEEERVGLVDGWKDAVKKCF